MFTKPSNSTLIKAKKGSNKTINKHYWMIPTGPHKDYQAIQCGQVRDMLGSHQIRQGRLCMSFANGAARD